MNSKNGKYDIFERLIEHKKVYTFEKAKNAYLEMLTLKNASPYTIRNFGKSLQKFENYLAISNPDVLQDVELVLKPCITGFISELKNQELKTASINSHLKAVKAFFNYLFKTGIIHKNPASNIPIIKERIEIKFIPAEAEIDNIMKKLDLSKFSDITTYTILQLCRYTGMRIGEVSQLKIDDIDFKKRELIVTANKTWDFRTLPLHETLERTLKAYISIRGETEHPFLFVSEDGKQLHVNSINRKVRFASERAGLKRNINVHAIRRFFGNKLYREGVDLLTISKMMGHHSLEITVKNYVREDSSKWKDAIDKL